MSTVPKEKAMGILDEIDSDIGLEAEDAGRIRSNRVNAYKGEKGRVDRASIVSFRNVIRDAVAAELRRNPSLSSSEAEAVAAKTKAALAKKLGKPVASLTAIDELNLDKVLFRLSDIHYDERPGIGYVVSRMGKDGDEADAIWGHLPPAEQVMTCLLLVYPTDRQGEIIERRLSNGWQIQPFKMKEAKYKDLMKLSGSVGKNGGNIANQDILIDCEESTFQKLKFSGDGPATWRKDPAMVKAVLTRALQLQEHMVPGKAMTTEELAAKLGVKYGGKAAQVSSTEDVDEMINNQGI